jgi:pyruvoyl-dependent arginine decarboxylase (PvlArgDC)
MLNTRAATDKNLSALQESAENVEQEIERKLANSNLARMDRDSIERELATLRSIQREASEKISWTGSQILRGRLSAAANRARSILS